MTAERLDGKALADDVATEILERLKGVSGTPGLAVVMIGSDPASAVYVRNKGRVAKKLGYYHEQVNLPAEISQAEVLAEIDRLNNDSRVHGILVQMPLPAHLDSAAIVERVAPAKDVDGFTSANTGRHALGLKTLVPCTPRGVMKILGKTGISLPGKRAVVLGRSNIVGRPAARMLEQAHCTVIVCHSRTADLAGEIGRADILVAAIGRPEFVRGAWLREGAIAIDVGINRLSDGRLVGDIEFSAAIERCSHITPVPGGVGPMTIAMLMENTFEAAFEQGALRPLA